MLKTDAPQNPLDTLWQAPTLVWMVLTGEAIALVLALSTGATGDRLPYFLLVSVATQWILLTSIAGLYVLRRLLRPLRPQVVAYVALGMFLLSTWIVLSAIGFFFRGDWEQSSAEWAWTRWRFMAIALAVGLLGLAAFNNHWRVRQMALRAKQAELESLQARIRPHFLFNTLNTGAALVHARPEEVERLLLDLADLFRAALAGPRDISLEDELALARRYLEIESLRFGPRLRANWKLPRELPDVRVPALSIQPLVENAIHHGIERRPEGGEIEIAVTTTPDTVVVRIINPLPPSSGVVNTRSGHQVGLNASQARIDALTGGRGSVATQREGTRFIATVRLPVGGT